MAGGNGVRLRPLTCSLPKPMVKLCGRPVMEHILLLLKKHGFTSVMATLGYLPQEIEDYFDGGRALGVSLACTVEQEPRGTAGSVKLCSEFIGKDDFLVISGDAVCDFDLSAAAKHHLENGADVTILTCRHISPTRYGLILQKEDGSVEGFLEKPSWNQVFSDLVNTGIYFIKASVLDKIPDNTAFDFAKDLFPKLMAEGRILKVYQADGYWCDIGDTDAYLQCAFDVLDRKVSLDLPAKMQKEGLYLATEVPQGVKIVPPCYIAADVLLKKGCVIGPYAVIEEGSRIDGGAVVEHSIIDRAGIFANCSLFGSIVSGGAQIKEGTGLSEGSVIGEGAVVGAGSVIYEGVHVYPRKTIPPGARVHTHVVTGHTGGISFESTGALLGEVNTELTPETMLSIGSFLGEKGDCGVSFSGGNAARMLMDAFSSGVMAAGGNISVVDAKTAAAMSFAGELYRFYSSAFIRGKGESAEVFLFDSDGLLLRKDQRRKMMSAVLRGEIPRQNAAKTGVRREITGLMRAYASSAAQKELQGFACTVPESEASTALAEALSICKAAVFPVRRKKLPVFELASDGLSLAAYDEDGSYVDVVHMAVLSAVCAVLSKDAETVAAYYDEPNVLEAALYEHGGRVLRVSREEETGRSLLKKQRFMRDGVFMAVNIAEYMQKESVQLKELRRRIPEFYTVTREVGISRNRASMMQALLNECEGMRHELCDGIKLCVDSGWIHISPLDRMKALRVTSEGMNTEIAEELCDLFSDRLRRLDQRGGSIE